jgi:putative transport protein
LGSALQSKEVAANSAENMTYVFEFLKDQPFILLFLVIAAGFVLARIKIFSISLGVVAWTLIFGLLLSLWTVHATNISFSLPPVLQTIYFNLYIFCVGLRVGPQCFAALERNGKPFVAVAVTTLIVTAALALLFGWFFHFDAGTLAGVIAGSSTASASP